MKPPGLAVGRDSATLNRSRFALCGLHHLLGAFPERCDAVLEQMNQHRHGAHTLLLVAVWALLLLLKTAAVSGAERPVYGPRLLPPFVPPPHTWTSDKFERAQRRYLQQQLQEDVPTATSGGAANAAAAPAAAMAAMTTSLPVCELSLGYRVVDLSWNNFTSILTLVNNREVGWQHHLQLPPMPGTQCWLISHQV